MIARSLFRITACLLAVGLAPSLTSAQPASLFRIEVPQVPATLEVPDGHEVFLHGRANGTQNYVCLPTAAGIRWQFIGPQATLYVPIVGDLQQQITTHFLSANPIEHGIARPTWLQSFDSSQVWGRALASSSDPNYVAAKSIPWLLLQAAGAAAGPTGGSLLTRTTYIHRLNTAGGIAPTGGCSQSTEVGALALVPYTTDYFFYRASRRR
jgi:Protein of unknown function (DUF3455)